MNATSIGPQLLAAIRTRDDRLARIRLGELDEQRAIAGMVLDPNIRLTPSEMVVTARTLERTAPGAHVTVGTGFLTGLVSALLELPIDDLRALRAEHAPSPEVPCV